MVVWAADTVATAVIAAGAAVLAAVLTTIGTILSARSKLTELEVTYQQRLADAHLAAAREHVDTIYIPLNAALSTLSDAFLELREEDEPDIDNATAAFRTASNAFLQDVKTITGHGKDAFLTTDLDARLRDFTAFLRASQTASKVSGKAVFRPFMTSIRLEAGLAGIALQIARTAGAISGPLSLGGAVVTVETDEVLAAPLASREFEQRFQRDVLEMKNNIRDVTLGAPAP